MKFRARWQLAKARCCSWMQRRESRRKPFNLYLAIENGLEIIPVINKIDIEGAMIEEVSDQIVDLIGCKHEDIIHASGKTGIGIDDILDAVIKRIPAPKGDKDAPLQALVFDSVFNSFRGVI